MANIKTTYKKRTRRIKRYLKKNHLKVSVLENITGLPRVSVSYIMNGIRYPKYTDGILTKIEEHFSIN